MKKSTLRRIIMILTCIFFIGTFFAANVTVFDNTAHTVLSEDCSGSNCTVCAHIHFAKSLLKQLAILGASIFILGFRLPEAVVINPIPYIMLPFSLVKQKVRLNN